MTGPARGRSGPVRTCVGCRRPAPMAGLARTVRLPGGSVAVDRVAPGRGAWICLVPRTGALEAACVDLAMRRSAFERALRGPVSSASVAALRASASERARIEGGAAVDAGPSGRD